jgi:intein/homing endonuclease
MADLDRVFWIRNNLRIITKDGRLIRLEPNIGQMMLHNSVQLQRERGLPVRVKLLKPRQVGWTTWTIAEGFYEVYSKPNWKAMAVSVDSDSTDNIFKMARTYHEELPASLQRKMDNTNKKEIVYSRPHRSSIISQTAGKLSLGRSFMAQYLLCSEIAFWENAATQMSGLEDVVSLKPGTTIIQETTANGQGGYFYEGFWEAVDKRKRYPDDYSDYIPVFFPWYKFPEYAVEPSSGFVFTREDRSIQKRFDLTDAQLYWRHLKIKEKNGDVSLFMQEYPACVVAGTRVGTNRGIIPVEQIVAGNVGTFGVVDHVYEQRPSQTYRLTTELGYIVEGTEDHPIFLAEGQPLFPDWKETVPLAKCIAGMKIALAPPMLAQEEYVEKWREAGVDCSVRITPDWGRFLGYFMGDGSYHSDTLSVVCTRKDEDVAADVDALIRKLLGLNPKRRCVGSHDGGTEIRVGSQRLRSAFGKLGIVELGKRKTRRIVKVPECIWRSPRAVIVEFLRGLFESDGFSNRQTGDVKFFSKYQEFIDDVQLLLLAFGITSKGTSVKKLSGDGHEYMGRELRLRAREALLFHQRIGFISARKRQNGRTKCRDKQPDVLSDRVKSVESVGVKITYDLTVRDGHAFDANGIKTHNTAREAFQQSGNPVFPPELIAYQDSTVKEPKRYLFDETSGVPKPELTDDSFSVWWILEMPKEGHSYSMGIDTAEGRLSDVNNPKSKLDMDGCSILDRSTGNYVAIYMGRGDQKELAVQAMRAAIFYNEAYVAPEIPQSMILLNYFKEHGYPNLYNRQRHEDRESETESEVLGWRTTAITRKWLVDDWITATKDSLRVGFQQIVDQMRTFVRTSNGRPDHLPGEHDDLLISAMIAYQAHKRCPMSDLPMKTAHTGEAAAPEREDEDDDLARIGAVDDWIPGEDDDDDNEEEYTA